MTDIPKTILDSGSVSVVWERVRTTAAMNYPLPGEERWLPEGTEGWAMRGRHGWTLLTEHPPAWHLGNGFNVSIDEQMEMLGEYVRVSYWLPAYVYEDTP